MQLISAVVRTAKVRAVCDALQAFGFRGLTVMEASGFGKQRGQTEIFRGAEIVSDFEHRAKIEIVARDEEVHDMIEVICQVAGTGRLGDGKIWVTPVRDLVRIRTREAGPDAL